MSERCEPEPELLPCPFCGKDADYLPIRLMAPGAPPPVFCYGCQASALDAECWNRRDTPPATVAALVEALEAVLALPVGQEQLRHLDGGIGTATPNAAWLRARAALALYREAKR